VNFFKNLKMMSPPNIPKLSTSLLRDPVAEFVPEPDPSGDSVPELPGGLNRVVVPSPRGGFYANSANSGVASRQHEGSSLKRPGMTPDPVPEKTHIMPVLSGLVFTMLHVVVVEHDQTALTLHTTANFTPLTKKNLPLLQTMTFWKVSLFPCFRLDTTRTTLLWSGLL
jgi:hypothetical protein